MVPALVCAKSSTYISKFILMGILRVGVGVLLTLSPTLGILFLLLGCLTCLHIRVVPCLILSCYAVLVEMEERWIWGREELGLPGMNGGKGNFSQNVFEKNFKTLKRLLFFFKKYLGHLVLDNRRKLRIRLGGSLHPLPLKVLFYC